jgi:hypothetical protein
MSKIIIIGVALAGAILLAVGAVQASTNSTSEGASSSVLVIGAGVVLLLGAAVGFLAGRRSPPA